MTKINFVRAAQMPVSIANLHPGWQDDVGELMPRAKILNACFMVRYYKRPSSRVRYRKAVLGVATIALETLGGAVRDKDAKRAELVLEAILDGLAERRHSDPNY